MSQITVSNLTFAYEGSYDTIFEGVSFQLDTDWKLGLIGRNGSGKSSILKLIMGEPLSFTGNLQVGSRLKISYVPQSTHGLEGSLSDYAREWGIDESRFRAILNKLDFSRIQMKKNMETFSQGQKKKVLLARSLCESAHLYVWDEPLNYIDLFSRMQIEELLMEWKPAMLLAEHDRAFVRKAADREVLLEG